MLPDIARFLTKNSSLIIILVLIGKIFLFYRVEKVVRRPLAMAGKSRRRLSDSAISEPQPFAPNPRMKNPKKFTHLYQLEKYFR